jgi:hypothetical protein
MANKADVVIKIEVKDGEAKRKLDAMEARLKALQGAGGGASSSIDKVTDSTEKMNRSISNSNDEFDKHSRVIKKSGGALSGLHGVGNRVKTLFGNLAKLAKFAGIEFGAMALVLGGLKAALVLGQYSMKAFQMGLTGLAAGAGLAIGALGGVLAAIRQVNNAKMAPYALGAKQSLTGPSAMSNKTSAIMGDQQLGMFKDATLNSAMTSAYKSGQQVDSTFKDMLSTLGNFAIVAGDPDKALGSLSEAFMQARKAGSFTEDSIKAITDASPELGKAVKESGMGVNEFMSALSAGNIKGLEHFNGALDRVNDTVMGRFKGALRVLKEDLTTLGGPIAELAKGPIPALQKQLHSFMVSISPAIQQAYAVLFPKLAQGQDGAIGGIFTKLAAAINTSLPKLENFSLGFGKSINAIKDFFSSIYDWMTKMTSGWDTLFNNILKPIGVEVWKTIEVAIKGFNDTILGTSGTSEKFADRIHGIFDGVRGLIEGFNRVRSAIAPITDTLLQLLQILGKLASNKILGTLMAGAGIAALVGRGGGGKGAMGLMGNFLLAGNTPKGNFAGSKLGQKVQPYRDTYSTLSTAPAGGIAMTTKAGAARAAGAQFAKDVGGKLVTGLKGFAPAAATIAAGVIGSKIQSSSKSTDAVGQGFGNALTMAATGAGMGMMMGGPVGGAIGGGLGLVAGGVMGVMGARDAQAKQVKDMEEQAKKDAIEGLDKSSVFSVTNRASNLRSKAAQIGMFSTYKDQRGELYGGDGLNIGEKGTADQNYAFASSLKDIYGASAEKFDKGDAQDRAAKAQIALAEAGDTLSASTKRQVEKLMEADTAYDKIYKKYGDSTDAVNKYKKTLEDQAKSLERQAKTILGPNLSSISSLLGKTGAEASRFGEAIGKDLLTNFITINDVIKGLNYTLDESGKVAVDAANKITGAQRSIGRVLKPIQDQIDKMDVQSKYNTAGTTLFNMKSPTEESATRTTGDFLQAMMEQKMTDYANNKDGTYRGFVGEVTTKLQSQLDYMKTVGVDPTVIAAFQAAITPIITNLNTGLTSFSTRLQEDPKFAQTLQSSIGTLVSSLNTDAFKAATGGEQALMIQGAVDGLTGMLAMEGITVNEADKVGITSMIKGGLQDAGVNIESAIITGMSTGTKAMVDALGKTKLYVTTLKKNEEIPVEDTSSPRAGRVGDTSSSRWASTLGKHMAFDQMAGKRTITSGVRNYNLGSPSSDHTTGAAYDLTGDNLGAYANSVNGAGGFAEFHGAAGSRHLHVVPPMGDSTTPALIGAMAASGGSTSNSYSIVVNGGSDNADIIARKVMAEIERNNRSNQERA